VYLSSLHVIRASYIATLLKYGNAACTYYIITFKVLRYYY